MGLDLRVDGWINALANGYRYRTRSVGQHDLAGSLRGSHVLGARDAKRARIGLRNRDERAAF